MNTTEEDLRVASELVEHFIVEHFLPQDKRRLADRIASAIATEREKAAKVAECPYADRVGAFGSDQPSVVGGKIARAIRANKE